MKRKILGCLALLTLTMSGFALADPIPVTYEIGTYAEGGYSASWLHEATGCVTTGSLGDLFMCGAAQVLTGTLTGDLENGLLTNIGGVFYIGGESYNVLGGQLGVFENANIWSITVESLGVFLFESLYMGDGMPNFFDGDQLILWGQNLHAYNCDPRFADCSSYSRWGIDLYGHKVSVSEPGTLALLGIGLLGVGISRRRKVKL